MRQLAMHPPAMRAQLRPDDCDPCRRHQEFSMTTAESLGGMNLFDAARAAGIQFTEAVLPEDKYVEANGMRLHYLDWGHPEKPAMLLLHGGAQSAHSWDFFSLAMRDHFHIVAV